MKFTYRTALNLFSFALLIIALYLNFIKKDSNQSAFPMGTQTSSPATSAINKKTTKIVAPSDGTLVLR